MLLPLHGRSFTHWDDVRFQILLCLQYPQVCSYDNDKIDIDYLIKTLFGWCSKTPTIGDGI